MFYNFITNDLEPLSYLIYAIALLLQVRTDKKPRTTLLFLYYVSISIMIGYASWLSLHLRSNNWIYNLSYLPSSLCICYYFHETFDSRKHKALIRLMAAVNLVYFIFSILILKNLSILDSFGYSLLHITVFVLSSMYLYGLIENVSEKEILRDFNFWLVAGYIIYYLVCFFILLAFQYLTQRILDTYTDEQRGLLTRLWGVQNILLFISSLITLFGSLWTTYRNSYY